MKDRRITSETSITLKAWPHKHLLMEHCCKVVRGEGGGRVQGLRVRRAGILREKLLDLPFNELRENVFVGRYCWSCLQLSGQLSTGRDWKQGTYEYNTIGTYNRIFVTAHSRPGEPNHFRVVTLTSHLWWAKTWIPAVCTAPTCHLPHSQRHLSHMKHSGRTAKDSFFDFTTAFNSAVRDQPAAWVTDRTCRTVCLHQTEAAPTGAETVQCCTMILPWQ